ncbi:Nucleotide-binding universal stress protein, UspA family [Rhizobiales bacterium GAS113]|nr:Nucleotide-binding universal stress protein, UspA family [Rhizobiales bacterium GAS113]
MSYKSVMVHVDPGSNAASRVKLAGGLADRFGAELIGIAAWRANLVGFTEYESLDQRWVEQESELASDKLMEAERAFREASGARNAAQWRSARGLPTPFLLEQARAADLIVVGRQGDADGRDERFDIHIDDALMDLGRPILIAPPGLEELYAERIIVAWKNTREARRAVWDSLPLLQRAEEVIVTTIGKDAAHQGADDVAGYLKRHDVPATTKLSASDDPDVTQEIFALSKRRHADLIVAGGYGHSRVREWVFGGVTRDLLRKTPVCCLMTH